MPLFQNCALLLKSMHWLQRRLENLEYFLRRLVHSRRRKLGGKSVVERDIKELFALLLRCSSVPCTAVEREDGHTRDVKRTLWGYKGVARTVCHQSHVVDSGLLVAVMQLLTLLTLLTEYSFLSLLPKFTKATSLYSQAKILFDQDDLIQDSSGSKQDQVLTVPGVIIVFFSGFSINNINNNMLLSNFKTSTWCSI